MLHVGDMTESVVIIGGGFAGAVTAIKLARAGCPALVTIVEPREELGRGVAYSTWDPDHLVNGPARLLGLYPGDAGHLPRWLEGQLGRRGWLGPRNGDFANCYPPRALYGDYVQSEVGKLGVQHVRDTAIDILPGGSAVLGSGRKLQAERVVLATGLVRNEHSFLVSDVVRASRRYIADPWVIGAYDSVESSGEIAIIGSGLTMVDVVISLEKRGFRGQYLVYSRHGCLVRSRREVEPWPLPTGRALPRTALALFRYVKRELQAISAAGDDWQRLMLALRPLVETVWAEADDAECRRFARHLRSLWDLAFHRGTPDSLEWLNRVRAQGRLHNAAARVQDLAMSGDRLSLTVRSRGSSHAVQRAFDHVVNAAGYESNWRQVSTPLVRNLVARGVVVPHPVGFGIEADASTGAVIDADGRTSHRLFAVGHPLRGAAWEASSIPEQIEGATRVARALSTPLTLSAGSLQRERVASYLAQR